MNCVDYDMALDILLFHHFRPTTGTERFMWYLQFWHNLFAVYHIYPIYCLLPCFNEWFMIAMSIDSLQLDRSLRSGGSSSAF